ncbi:hypothetical protein [Metabacillus niabensis]|uniref:hypothetical protein n=1 Tax=Metabacillus niabensis TaxID=324854 RepID=UPI001CF99AFD|nr:hypothetical protein [Metabacillus niabensis]
MATFRKRGDKWEYRISYKNPFSLIYSHISKNLDQIRINQYEEYMNNIIELDI